MLDKNVHFYKKNWAGKKSCKCPHPPKTFARYRANGRLVLETVPQLTAAGARGRTVSDCSTCSCPGGTVSCSRCDPHAALIWHADMNSAHRYQARSGLSRSAGPRWGFCSSALFGFNAGVKIWRWSKRGHIIVWHHELYQNTGLWEEDCGSQHLLVCVSTLSSLYQKIPFVKLTFNTRRGFI